MHNPADRDHCLQYMVACGLLFGDLVAEYYEDDIASDKRIDNLRDKMSVVEDKDYSEEYHNPEKRSIANAIQIFFKDGSSTDKVEVEYPLGHRFRRDEGIPVLVDKFKKNVYTRFPKRHGQEIIDLCLDEEAFLETPVNEFMNLLVI